MNLSSCFSQCSTRFRDMEISASGQCIAQAAVSTAVETILLTAALAISACHAPSVRTLVKLPSEVRFSFTRRTGCMLLSFARSSSTHQACYSTYLLLACSRVCNCCTHSRNTRSTPSKPGNTSTQSGDDNVRVHKAFKAAKACAASKSTASAAVSTVFMQSSWLLLSSGFAIRVFHLVKSAMHHDCAYTL